MARPGAHREGRFVKSETPPVIDITRLPPVDDVGRPSPEWQTFRRERDRLIAERHEGKWALLSRGEVVGLFEAEGAARDDGYRRFFEAGFLVQPVATYQPTVRCPRWLYFACPTHVTL